jgi:hypothetical protein
MGPFYEAIGRLVVLVIRVRYGKQMRIAALLGVGATVAAGYLLASRDVEEG